MLGFRKGEAAEDRLAREIASDSVTLGLENAQILNEAVRRVVDLEDQVVALAEQTVLLAEAVETVITLRIKEIDGEEAVEREWSEVVREFLEQAIEREVAIDFDYTKAALPEKVEDRTVSPWKVEEWNEAVTLLGYDHDREAVRRFSVERITLPGPSLTAEYERPSDDR